MASDFRRRDVGPDLQAVRVATDVRGARNLLLAQQRLPQPLHTGSPGRRARVLRPDAQVLFTKSLVLTGPVSNEEVRRRTFMVFFMVIPPGANIRPPTSTTALDRSSARFEHPFALTNRLRTEGTDSDLDPRLPATAHILRVVISRHVDRRFRALTMRIAWRHVARTEHVNRPRGPDPGWKRGRPTRRTRRRRRCHG